MNMNKALQNLYHAVSGSTTTKVNISKLLVDIHYAITGKESENKNNWSKIINSMADNWPEGGGGSSDFSTAEVTITLAKTNSHAQWFAPMIYFEELGVMFSLETESAAVSDSFTVVLYNNNSCGLEFYDSEESTYTNISVTGDIAVDDGYVTISGNGTITISDTE